MIRQDGVISAVERCVEHETSGYTSLVELGFQRFTFEVVVLCYPNSLSGVGSVQRNGNPVERPVATRRDEQRDCDRRNPRGLPEVRSWRLLEVY